MDAKAPTSHASTGTTYGLGTTSNYGHVKTVNGLTQASHSNGTALSAYQGYVLKGLIDAKSDFSGSYNDLTDVPTSFPPASHDHDDRYYTESEVDTLLDDKLDVNDAFSGSYNDLTNKPSIPSATSDLTNDSGFITSSSLPTKTSDLTNDGADGTNVFVASNDSRLSDARTPTSHTHGQVTNDGKITSSAVTVASGDNIVITDASDSSKLKRVANVLATHIKDSNAHSNIGTSASATQGAINTAIDTALGGKASSSHTHTESQITDLGDYIETSAIANNLTTTSSGYVLDARQGKALADLIGDAITYINQ